MPHYIASAGFNRALPKFVETASTFSEAAQSLLDFFGVEALPLNQHSEGVWFAPLSRLRYRVDYAEIRLCDCVEYQGKEVPIIIMPQAG